MSPRQAAPAPGKYRSGWCSTSAHHMCRGHYAGVDCRCACHVAPPPAPPAVCSECGRPYEDTGGAARLAALADLIPPCPSDDP